MANQLAGYARIEKDLRNLAEWLVLAVTFVRRTGMTAEINDGKMIATPSELTSHLKALTVAIITTYGKLYTQADGRRLSLDKTWIESLDHKRIHEWWMNARHNFTAHAGNSDIENCRVVAVFEKSKVRGKCPLIVPEMVQMSYVGEKDLYGLHDLITVLHKRTVTKISQLRSLIIEKEISIHSNEYWRAHSEETARH